MEVIELFEVEPIIADWQAAFAADLQRGCCFKVGDSALVVMRRDAVLVYDLHTGNGKGIRIPEMPALNVARQAANQAAQLLREDLARKLRQAAVNLDQLADAADPEVELLAAEMLAAEGGLGKFAQTRDEVARQEVQGVRAAAERYAANLDVEGLEGAGTVNEAARQSFLKAAHAMKARRKKVAAEALHSKVVSSCRGPISQGDTKPVKETLLQAIRDFERDAARKAPGVARDEPDPFLPQTRPEVFKDTPEGRTLASHAVDVGTGWHGVVNGFVQDGVYAGDVYQVVSTSPNAGKALPADDLKVSMGFKVPNVPDRNGDIFTPESLADAARQLEEKGIQFTVVDEPKSIVARLPHPAVQINPSEVAAADLFYLTWDKIRSFPLPGPAFGNWFVRVTYDARHVKFGKVPVHGWLEVKVNAPSVLTSIEAVRDVLDAYDGDAMRYTELPPETFGDLQSLASWVDGHRTMPPEQRQRLEEIKQALQKPSFGEAVAAALEGIWDPTPGVLGVIHDREAQDLASAALNGMMGGVWYVWTVTKDETFKASTGADWWLVRQDSLGARLSVQADKPWEAVKRVLAQCTDLPQASRTVSHFIHHTDADQSGVAALHPDYLAGRREQYAVTEAEAKQLHPDDVHAPTTTGTQLTPPTDPDDVQPDHLV